VPRKNTEDGEASRRRRGAKATAVEANAERGLALRILLHSPKDTIAGIIAFGAASAIVTNALFLQVGPHPAPMFGSTVVNLAAAPPAPSLLPRPRPAEADTSSEPKWTDSKASEFKTSEPRVSEKAAEAKSVEPKSADPLTNLVKAMTPSPSPQPATIATAPANPVRAATPSPSPQPSITASLPSSSTMARPPASIPLTGARRVAAVQRALTEYGYGQLKPTGTIGSDTQSAIRRFERDRELPVTGQVSDRLVRELSAMIGHPVE
jgi:putative peptidoglycan binding protein